MAWSTSAIVAALRRQQQHLETAFPGVVTIAGETVEPCAIRRTPIQLTMPGGGAVETHGMTISFDKVLLSSEPVIGSTVVESDREYIINSVSGGETWATSWRVQCVEKERQ